MIRSILLLAALASVLPACPLRAASPDDVDHAIDKAKAYLYSIQHNGHWEETDTRQHFNPGQYGNLSADQWGGATGIITYALLAAGERPNSDRLAPAIAFLKKADLVGNYALAMRSQVWQALPPSPEIRDLARRDAATMLASIKTKDQAEGFFHYYRDPTSTDYDHSVSQYVVLGLWACDQAGYEVPTDFWRLTDRAWRKHQFASGAWSYKYKWGAPVDQEERASMTEAGIATLFVTQEYLHLSTEAAGNVTDHNIEQGIRWLADKATTNFEDNIPRQQHSFDTYALYGMERIGVAGGYKYFGTCNWYERGADYLLHNQSQAGSWDAWNSKFSTAFGLLFLARGRGPVVMNKLQYKIAGNGDGNWNERPRDAANIARWVGKQIEEPCNWQIVNLSVSEGDLHDSPILYLAGNQALNFSADDQAKLKKFVEDGGLILGNADGASKAFSDSFHALGAKMFPDYEFRELPDDHVIYRQQYRRNDWKNPPTVLGLSNGVRELMILLPTADMAKAWQGHLTTRKDAYEFLEDLYLYASDHQNLRKGAGYMIWRDDKIPTKQTLKVARLQYAGNWDPEPGGWRRLANQLHNRFGVDLQVDAVTPGEGKLSGYAVAHLTGTTKFSLPEAAQLELRTFIKNGGILLVDAAGGAPGFIAPADALCLALFPEAPDQLKDPMKSDNPMFSIGGNKNATASYRRFAKKALGATDAPQIRGLKINDHIGLFFSREDLSCGLVGQPIDGITGYTPASSLEILDSILMYAASRQK
jgi:hypothetical protein